MIIENCGINFFYALEDKNVNFSIRMTSKISRYFFLFKDGNKSLIFENNRNQLKGSEAEIDIETLATFERNSWKDSPIVLCKGLPYNDDDETYQKKYLKNLNLK